MAVELTIPTAGESITEVQIGQWLKAEGDAVELDEPVVEVETDKASMELPSPVTGVIAKLLKEEGEIVPVGSVIALLEESDRPADAASLQKQTSAGAEADAAVTATATAKAPRVMPAARRALAQAGLDARDVQPTGPGGRLLKEDVQRHVAEKSTSAKAATPENVGTGLGTGRSDRSEVGPAGASANDGQRLEESVPMTMLRRRVAQRLVDSQQNTASLTTFNEIDMSRVITLRKERGEAFQKRYDIKLGFMSFFVKAAIDALKAFPAVNGEIRGDNIVYKNYFDIGVAVSTEQGLIVPVMRHAERLSFAEVEAAIADLATRARGRKITVEELQGGTFTITNGGIFGSLLATPIINYPQSAILGLHAIQERPVVINGQVVVRPMMYVALTYDHRIIDGRESVSFLKRIKDCIEDPARMLIEV